METRRDTILRMENLLQGMGVSPEDHPIDITHLAPYFQGPVIPSPLQEEDDAAFPLRVVELGTTPVPMGSSYIRDMPAFTAWMDTQATRATLETPP